MDNRTVQKLLAELTTFDLVAWSITFLLILAGMVLIIRLEKRTFQAKNKGRSWLWLRLWSLPILLLSITAVVLPASNISGMEALAYFYLALFTIGPLIWFGLHWIVGYCLSPRLSVRESTHMALTGLLVLIAPAVLVSMLQGPLFMASHLWNQNMFALADVAPLPHRLQPPRRFRLGDAEIYTQTLQAPAGVHVERIEALFGEHWQNTRTIMHPYFCRQGEDIHLAWTASTPPPPLRLFWQANGSRQQAEFRITTAGLADLPVREFTIAWREDGIDLPVPLNRVILQLGWLATNNVVYYELLNLQPGENFENDCVVAGYHRVDWQKEGPVAGVKIGYYEGPAGSWWHEITRPE